MSEICMGNEGTVFHCCMCMEMCSGEEKYQQVECVGVEVWSEVEGTFKSARESFVLCNTALGGRECSLHNLTSFTYTSKHARLEHSPKTKEKVNFFFERKRFSFHKLSNPCTPFPMPLVFQTFPHSLSLQGARSLKRKSEVHCSSSRRVSSRRDGKKTFHFTQKGRKSCGKTFAFVEEKTHTIECSPAFLDLGETFHSSSRGCVSVQQDKEILAFTFIDLNRNEQENF